MLVVVVILYVIALFIGLAGVLRCIAGDWLAGVVLILIAFAVGPGGVSVFT